MTTPTREQVVHPTQPLVTDPHGVIRFKENKIVSILAEGRLNELACMDFTVEDSEQLAQLIGYSLSGFGTLSYVTDETFERAQVAQADLEATIAEQAAEIERWRNDCHTFHKEMTKRESSIWQLRQQLTEQAAHIERLREALVGIREGYPKNSGAAIAQSCDDALSIPSSADALREYGAKLVERIRKIVNAACPTESTSSGLAVMLNEELNSIIDQT